MLDTIRANTTSRGTPIIPALHGLYSRLDRPARTLLRVVCGLTLVTHGFPAIMNPFDAIGMVERLGFYPGVLWSPLPAATEFFGGLFLAVDVLTLPAVLAATVLLLATV
ncbi:DoxX family protein [Rubellimicrobium arenae]|uniref:DoxX family protein n=1 Tax=Rubellimicrobium arenae TaxID=2817372 RepID=UPI001B30CDAA|nr:DoxX family protein [Rubellimicrobium arenae]